MPRPASARTTTTKTSRRWPVVRSIAIPRYLDRRRDRAQNGAAGGFSAPPAAPFDDPERVPPAPAGHPLPVAGRGGDAGGPWRTACCPPVCRSAGCAPLCRAVPAPAAPLRAQPAEGPATGGAPCEDGGSGGAARPVARAPASGHCRAATWLSAEGAADIPSGTVAPAAETPPAPPCAASLAPPESAVPRRAQRDVARAPAPGATTPAAPAVARRKPKVDSRQLTWARSSAPSMP